MKRLNYFLFLIFISYNSLSFSQNHNQLEVDLERVKKDVIDLQKFVYKNEEKISINENKDLNKILSDISDRLTSLENQMMDMKRDISDFYDLHTSSQFNTNKTIDSSKKLNIDESSSKIVLEKKK